jgi:hypothetical protein
MSRQYLRKVGLAVTDGSTTASPGANALDLSNFRIVFHVYAADEAAPRTAVIRVYNLKKETVGRISKEYQNVILQAGYENSNFGLIFQGEIKQLRRGREDSLNSFVDIMATDADKAHQLAFVNKTLAAGSTRTDEAKAVVQSMDQYGVKTSDLGAISGSTTPTGGVVSIRGKTLWGMAASRLDDVSKNATCSWSIHNGVLQFTAKDGFQKGEIIKLNSKSGLIGVPEATDGGIVVRSLLNPFYAPGRRIQINQADINATLIKGAGYPSYSSVPYVADVTSDGVYRLLVCEHYGDNRGQPFYSDLVLLSLDGGAAVTSL